MWDQTGSFRAWFCCSRGGPVIACELERLLCLHTAVCVFEIVLGAKVQ